MGNNNGRLRAFMVAFLITSIIIVGVILFFTTLYRMENTISPNGYQLLAVQKTQDEKLSVTIMNNTYILDYNEAIEQVKPYLQYEYLVPCQIRSFAHTLSQLSGLVSDSIERFF